ncbi:hypothetical protein cce_1502 [Crocosphaera subtropica ATCC 51142]|uniref:Uncharacterized protein n=1 Tax=Crocosphaera subtropica (strain ATCC 51142 / BH68) TaxID=43989 RepID=B1WXA8_CROS5|nr:hypothetical protein cce_1502 [Crocosphaera subtropica ATCC 51142]
MLGFVPQPNLRECHFVLKLRTIIILSLSPHLINDFIQGI